jgi:hypothetical protein
MAMITGGTTFRFQYLYNGFWQTKRLITQEEVDQLEKNKEEWRNIPDPEERKRYEKKNKVFLNPDEMHPESVMGKAVQGKKEGDICLVNMPPFNQGEDFEIKILEVKNQQT